MKDYDDKDLMEMSLDELEVCSGGRLSDDQCQDVLRAMVQAHLKADKLRNSGKGQEAFEYLKEVTDLYRKFGGLYPKPEYEGVYFSEMIDLS